MSFPARKLSRAFEEACEIAFVLLALTVGTAALLGVWLTIWAGPIVVVLWAVKKLWP